MAVAGIRAAQQAPHYRLQRVDVHRAVTRHCHSGCHARLLVNTLESLRYFATSEFQYSILQEISQSQ